MEILDSHHGAYKVKSKKVKIIHLFWDPFYPLQYQAHKGMYIVLIHNSLLG